MTVNHHPAVIAGWTIAVLGLAIYLLTILGAVVRVGRQYGATMQGKIGLRVAAGLTAAQGRWYFLLVGLIGVTVALLSK